MRSEIGLAWDESGIVTAGRESRSLATACRYAGTSCRFTRNPVMLSKCGASVLKETIPIKGTSWSPHPSFSVSLRLCSWACRAEFSGCPAGIKLDDSFAGSDSNPKFSSHIMESALAITKIAISKGRTEDTRALEDFLPFDELRAVAVKL